MNLGIRFFISWILTALVMFTLFYYWHGVILNDFKRLNFPLTVYEYEVIRYITVFYTCSKETLLYTLGTGNRFMFACSYAQGWF